MAMYKGDILYIIQASTTMEKLLFEDFIENGGCSGMVWQPLRSDLRAKFDVDKAWAWFENGIEGLSYGYENVLLSFIDSPDNSFPLITDSNDWIWTFILMEKIDRGLTDKF